MRVSVILFFNCIRSLYIDWRMVVVEGGNVLHHVKREGELSGRVKCPGGHVRGGNVPGECSTLCRTGQWSRRITWQLSSGKGLKTKWYKVNHMQIFNIYRQWSYKPGRGINRTNGLETECSATLSAVQRQCYKQQKGKDKGLDTCYSAAYMSQTRDQQRFTISEVAADWHESMVPQRIMCPSIACANGQLDTRCS